MRKLENLHNAVSGVFSDALLMKGKEYKGHCYINPHGFKAKQDFEFFINLCLDYNKIAKASKKKAKPKA